MTDRRIAAPGQTVAIVGAGFTGTVTALALAADGARPVLIERDADSVARGIAYGTRDPAHLLNVPAAKMSAWPGTPDDFAAFAAERAGLSPTDFAPRRLYGDYLAEQLAEAEAAGAVERVTGEAVAAQRAEGGWTVVLGDGETVAADALVLATGNGRPAPLDIPGLGDRLVQDPWCPQAAMRLAEAARANAPILLIGTGLTMVDQLLTLDRLGHRGPVTAVSRRGLVPRAHAAVGGALPPPAIEEIPQRLSDAVAWLRAQALGVDWRVAVDMLRPVTQALWASWDADTKARFLRHARPWWDVHRHRIAPEAAAAVERWIADGRLTVIAGRYCDADAETVRIARRGGGEARVAAALAVNCTGPRDRLDQARDPILKRMLADGLIAAGPLGIGVAVGADGKAGEALWALGPLGKGEWWEITAVPDVRVQVVATASD